MLTDDQIQEWEDQLPEWATAHARGDYTLKNCALPTKDGRITGNAVNVGSEMRHSHLCYKVITDAGNILFLVQSEMEHMFHPPEFIMRDLLVTHHKALLDEGMGL